MSEKERRRNIRMLVSMAIFAPVGLYNSAWPSRNQGWQEEERTRKIEGGQVAQSISGRLGWPILSRARLIRWLSYCLLVYLRTAPDWPGESLLEPGQERERERELSEPADSYPLKLATEGTFYRVARVDFIHIHIHISNMSFILSEFGVNRTGIERVGELHQAN